MAKTELFDIGFYRVRFRLPVSYLAAIIHGTGSVVYGMVIYGAF